MCVCVSTLEMDKRQHFLVTNFSSYYFVALWVQRNWVCSGRKCLAIEWLWLSSRICFNKFYHSYGSTFSAGCYGHVCGSVRCMFWHYLHRIFMANQHLDLISSRPPSMPIFLSPNDFDGKLKFRLREHPLRWPVAVCRIGSSDSSLLVMRLHVLFMLFISTVYYVWSWNWTQTRLGWMWKENRIELKLIETTFIELHWNENNLNTKTKWENKNWIDISPRPCVRETSSEEIKTRWWSTSSTMTTMPMMMV